LLMTKRRILHICAVVKGVELRKRKVSSNCLPYSYFECHPGVRSRRVMEWLVAEGWTE